LLLRQLPGILLAFCLLSLSAADRKLQPAIIKELVQISGPWEITLDFVEIRDCNCDAGFEIVNTNKKLRRFTLSEKTKILLLKNAGEYREATITDLAAARDGKDFGWRFDKDCPFEFRFDAKNKTVVEMRQVYLP